MAAPTLIETAMRVPPTVMGSAAIALRRRSAATGTSLMTGADSNAMNCAPPNRANRSRSRSVSRHRLASGGHRVPAAVRDRHPWGRSRRGRRRPRRSAPRTTVALPSTPSARCRSRGKAPQSVSPGRCNGRTSQKCPRTSANGVAEVANTRARWRAGLSRAALGRHALSKHVTGAWGMRAALRPTVPVIPARAGHHGSIRRTEAASDSRRLHRPGGLPVHAVQA